MNGLFIVFEGIDGSGKTIASQYLCDWFIDQNKPVLLTKEPSDHFLHLLDNDDIKLQYGSKYNEYLIRSFSYDRFRHLYEYQFDDISLGIVQALNMGWSVICDRYIYSTYAYNCQTTEELLLAKVLNSNFPKPDIVFYMDIPIINAINNIIWRDEDVKNAEDLSKDSYTKYFIKYERILSELKQHYEALEEFPTFHQLKVGNTKYDNVYSTMINIVQQRLK